MILPPAPTPSFANPSENALRPEYCEFFKPGLTEIAGMSDISFTKFLKFALSSLVMYEVVPIAVFSSLNPSFDANANTAVIWVPPANITLETSEAELNIPATKGIIGSPTFATIL